MMKDLILIIGDNTYQFDKMEELYDNVIGKNDGKYSSLSENEKAAKRYDMAFINVGCNPDRIGYLTNTPAAEVQSSKKLFIDTDESYVLSILKSGIATLLVSKETDLGRAVGLDETMSDNYVIINLWAGRLLSECREKLLAEQEKSTPTQPKVSLAKTSMPNFDKEKSTESSTPRNTLPDMDNDDRDI